MTDENCFAAVEPFGSRLELFKINRCNQLLLFFSVAPLEMNSGFDIDFASSWLRRKEPEGSVRSRVVILVVE